MKYISKSFLASLFFVSALPLGAQSPDPSTLDAKVNDLLSRMTLEEKIGQMTQAHQWKNIEKKTETGIQAGKIGSILNLFGAKNANEAQKIAVEKSRLHIPLLFGMDVIHGYKTIFPIPLAEDCAWNPGLLQQCASIAAKEASAAGIRWTFAPMVDVSREPRWGRIAEGSGEDPTLGCQMAAARVRGFQGQSLSAEGSIAACAKHFVGYGAAESGRDYNSTDMSEVTLREVHLPPFKAALDAGARTFMSAFNDLNGIPASGNVHTLREILKGEWGFQGFVVSDWASLEQMIDHGYAADKKEAALRGIQAGVDMDMVCDVYKDHLPTLLKEKKIDLALINDAVRRILRVKFELGLFDHPYVEESKEESSMLTPQALDLAREEAHQSIVLLKNEKNLLPLSKNLKTIAVIGPLAISKRDPLGSWICRGEDILDKVITVLDGIKEKVSPETKVLYAAGVDVKKDSPQSAIEEAVETAKKAQVAILVVGETQDMSGEAASRSSLSLPGRQEEMVQAVQKTGVPVVLVLMNGRPLTIPWEAEHVPAIVESWYLGITHGAALADILFGDTNPSGKLVVTFPRNLGQVPIYYSRKNTGRPESESSYTSKYLDSPNSPQFPFGFGLSYTQFTYSQLKLSAKTINPSGDLRASATIKNNGRTAGAEIIQLYLRDLSANLTQPVKKLVDFQRIFLNPGQTQRVEFILSAGQLSYQNEKGEKRLEPGQFQVWIGRDSSDETLKGGFELTSLR